MSRHVTMMAIDDAEHISAEQRAVIVASYPAHEREARTRGIPSLGAGRVFPVAEEDIVVPAMAIPRDVPRARVERLFTRDRWLDRCEALYAEVCAAKAETVA